MGGETVLVTGTFDFEPGERDAFIEAHLPAMRKARVEDGCEQFVLALDPTEPGRVVMAQRWRDRAALDAHIAGERGGGGPTPTSVSIEFHTVSSTEKVV
jgi:quinol monooxygenase YgiN